MTLHPNELTLNDYVDETLTAAERAEVERHLAGCDACRSLVASLGAVRRAAAALDPLEPPSSTWPRIERAIRREPARGGSGRTFFAAAQTMQSVRWLAAAAVLVLATIVGIRFARTPRPATPAPASAAAVAEPATAQSVESELREAEQHYQKAISGLEQIANSEKGTLDPATAATLQKNLAVIDQAINESRVALQAQPNSEPAQQSLLDSFKTKLALLQDTVALINEMRKGDDAGAAKAVSGLKQKS